MDSFELNKLIGAFLAVVFVLFSISIVSEGIFAAPVPEKPGYAIEAAEEDTGGQGAPEKEAVPIATLLASADPAAGETAFKKCTACHTAENGGANKVGPNLWNIVNRPIASHEGFSYSGPMKEFSQGGSVVWDYDHLNHFLTAPKAYIKGTAMGFAGIKNDEERGNLIAYLRTLSDSPAPLPEAQPAAEGASAPAGEQPAGQAPAAEQPTESEQAPAQEGQQPAPQSQDTQQPVEGGQQPAGGAQQGQQPAGEGTAAPSGTGQPAPAEEGAPPMQSGQTPAE